MIIANATAEQLSTAMDFYHIVRVLPYGMIDTSPAPLYVAGLDYAPEMLDDELDSEQWTLLTGYTGQYGYNGPTFHSSEFIGGGLATHILSTPGYYVAVMSNHSPQTPEDEAADETGEYDGIEGWGIAYHA